MNSRAVRAVLSTLAVGDKVDVRLYTIEAVRGPDGRARYAAKAGPRTAIVPVEKAAFIPRFVDLCARVRK